MAMLNIPNVTSMARATQRLRRLQLKGSSGELLGIGRLRRVPSSATRNTIPISSPDLAAELSVVMLLSGGFWLAGVAVVKIDWERNDLLLSLPKNIGQKIKTSEPIDRYNRDRLKPGPFFPLRYS